MKLESILYTMQIHIKAKTARAQIPGKLQQIIQSGAESKSNTKSVSNEHIEKELNARILEVTMKIRYHYPELSKYLDEVPVTIPEGNDRGITLNHLREYYESLSSIMNQYKLEIPKVAGWHKIPGLTILNKKTIVT